MDLLENVVLTVASTDIEGVSSVKDVPDFKLSDDKESIFDLNVPDNLQSLSFLLRAKVKNLSLAKQEDVADCAALAINGIDRTPAVQDMHLGHVSGNYFLDALGKTGEPKPDRAVNFTIKHQDFKEEVHVSLRTDAAGRIALGTLAGIDWISAQDDAGLVRRWFMVHDHHSYPSIVTGSTSEAIYIPYMGAAEKITPDAFSLLETHGGSFVADRLNTLTLQGGFLVIQGLSGGDYDLLIKNSQTHISVQIADGPAQLGYAMGGYRLLELPNPLPLQIVSVWTEKDLLKIQLANAGKTARVHVAAAKYMPEFSMFETLMRNPDEPASATFWSPQSFYVSGRNIGDEYRYILDRKYATHFPGNMLDRPGLLLNPWAINKTETAVNEAQAGEAYEKKAGDAADKMEKLAKDLAASNYYDKIKGVNASPNLDYLSQTSAVLTNLVPDDHGLVTVKLADLGPHQQIRVLALDGRNTAEREVSMGEKKMDFLDLRLGNEALDPSKHFVEQKEITAFTKGQTLTLDDIGSSRLETYASVGRVYRLYQTLSNDPKLVEFSFVLDWPKMKPEQKREKYSQFACHELNFFLSKKDPEFFEKVVQPYLKNKKDKTFLDHYLIGDDLSSYVQPWAYAQLNTAEKILLAQRLAGEAPKTARHVNDLYDLIPPDIERLNFLFKTALASASMDTGNIIGNGGLVTIIQSPDMLGPGTGVSGAVHALGGKDSNAQGEAVAAEDAAKPGAPPAPEAARAP